MKGQKLSMRSIHKILEYRLEKGVSADQTHLALKVSKGSVINLLKRFKASSLSWPLSDDISDAALDELLYPKNSIRLYFQVIMTLPPRRNLKLI